MNLSQLKSHTPRKSSKRVGRGGKRGTFSGHGTKGQSGRAGASVKPGFRGGDNRAWQVFPKQRGASKKHGSKRPHAKHRFFMLRQTKPDVFNLSDLNQFSDGAILTPKLLAEQGLIADHKNSVKILGQGEIKRKLEFEGFTFSKSAQDKVLKAGGIIK